MRYLFIVDVTEHKTLQHLLLVDIRIQHDSSNHY